MNTYKRRYSIYKKILSILMIISILAPTLITSVSKAEQKPDNIRVVTDELEKKELLGIYDNNGVGILGIAERFSVFAFDNLNLKAADIEGRVAVGGELSATTSYEYDIGWKNEDKKSADIILGKGPMKNIALYNRTKVAVSSNATNMNWSDFSGEEISNSFVESDLIDFNTEYVKLKQVSTNLKKFKVNGTIKYNENSQKEQYIIHDDQLSGDITNRNSSVTIFSGSDEKLNVFKLSAEEWNKIEGAIAFDIPSDSKIIINITGNDNVKLCNKFGFYFLIDEKFLATADMNKQDLGYIDYEGDLIRDSKGSPKVFARVTPGKLNNARDNITISNELGYEHAQRILWNITESDSFEFSKSYNDYCFMGTILAMNANGIDQSKSCRGYLQGSLICKSYSGTMQIGYAPFTYDHRTEINISKVDRETQENVEGAELALYKLNTDENGEILYNKKIETWISNKDPKCITLDYGSYILKENTCADSYENIANNYTVFEVKKVADLINGELDYSTSIILDYAGNNRRIYINEHTADLSYFPTYWDALYKYNSGNLVNEVLNRGKRVSKLEFTVNSVDESIKNKDLYVLVADANGKLNDTKKLDWVEFKRWTKVEIGEVVETQVPLIKYFYPYKLCEGTSNISYVYDERNSSIISFKPHFYVKDGDVATEVTDLVTISNIKAHWYEGVEKNIKVENYLKSSSSEQNGKEFDYFTVNEKNDTILIANDHIKTTVEITKQDSNSQETLLQGAIYEIQDSEGNVVKDLEGNKLTFEATDTEGKSTLEDLRLDVGTYYLVEVQAPAYYKISEEKIPFTVKPHTSETITKTVKDEKIKVNVEKQDEYGNLLAGANLQILDKNEKVIKTWTSKNMVEEIEGLSPGEYTLHENYAPTGFMKADDIQFTVTKQGKVTIDEKEVEKVVMINKNLKGTISITKRGETLEEVSRLGMLERYIVYKFVWKENPLENVIYDLYAKNDILVNGTRVYSKDEKITTISTGFDGVADYSGLVAGDYYVMEKCAPNQYEIDNEKHDISLIVTYDENNNQKLIATTGFVNERKKETIELTKTEKGSSNAVEGAIYGLYNQESIGSIAENTLLDVVMTDELGKGKFDADLPVGNYYVKEIEAPNGYLLSEESKYINFNESTDFKINVEDDYIKVNILKTDKNGNALPGAKLQITDKEGNIIVPEWTSEESAKEISKTLNVGETYILEEIEAPDGYVKSANKTFVVLNTAEVQEIVMIDNETKIAINKQDEDRNALAGAKLQLLDENGNQIEGWTSTEKPYEINGKLVVGKTYTIKETKAPDGYIKAEKVIFKVEDTEETQKVEMIDGYTKVKIEKVDENEKYLKGAELQIINEKGNVVEKWTTDNNAHEINKKLLAGGTYTLQEIDAPNGYKKAEDIIFKVSENGEIDTIKMVNIKEKTKASEVIKNIVQGSLPKTGDAVVIYVIIIIVALGSIVIIIILKNTERKK